MSRLSTAATAVKIDSGVNKLSALVELHAAMWSQQAVEAFGVRAAQVGVTQAAASAFLGVDLRAEMAGARKRAEKALVVLGPSSPVSPAAIQALYASVDGGGLTPTDAIERFGRIENTTAIAINSGVNDLESDARPTHADSLVAALESLRVANSFVDVATPEGSDVSALWFPSLGTTSQATLAVVARLGAESADYASASRRIHDLSVPSVVAGLNRIDADPGVRAFDHAVSVAQHGGAAGDPGLVFRGYMARATLLDGLVVTATAAVHHEAQQLASSERRSFAAWAALAALLTAASLAVAIALGRSIAKPLRDLAEYAHAVNEGRLDADPSHGAGRGPPETRVAFRVFTDLVANLQLLDAKANALLLARSTIRFWPRSCRDVSAARWRVRLPSCPARSSSATGCKPTWPTRQPMTP